MDDIQKNLNCVHINNDDDVAEIICKNTSAASKTFDIAVGHIEDIIIGKEKDNNKLKIWNKLSKQYNKLLS